MCLEPSPAREILERVFGKAASEAPAAAASSAQAGGPSAAASTQVGGPSGSSEGALPGEKRPARALCYRSGGSF
eukprot:2677815-Lingulodinium_polyedra.AAC.1